MADRPQLTLAMSVSIKWWISSLMEAEELIGEREEDSG